MGREAPSDAQYGFAMSWWRYVVQTSGTESPKAMQNATQIDGPNFSKWKTGQIPRAETVAKFARAYRRPVLEAFVAAGFLTPEEAKVRPAGAVDYTKLSNQELLEIVASRMSEEGGEHGGDTAATKPPGPSPDISDNVTPLPQAAKPDQRRVAAKKGTPRDVTRGRAQREAGEENQDPGGDEPR